MKFCQQCGNNLDGMKFCTICGYQNEDAPIPQPEVQPSPVEAYPVPRPKSSKWKIVIPLVVVIVLAIFVGIVLWKINSVPKLPNSDFDVVKMSFERDVLDRHLEKMGFIPEDEDTDYLSWYYEDYDYPLLCGAEIFLIETPVSDYNKNEYFCFSFYFDDPTAYDLAIKELDSSIGKSYTFEYEDEERSQEWLYKDRVITIYYVENEAQYLAVFSYDDYVVKFPEDAVILQNKFK